MRRRALLTAALALAPLAACAPPRQAALPQGEPRYMVGEPYQMGGLWSYPREDFSLVQTGFAAVAPEGRAGRRTANGEAHDPTAMMAAHRTLQLPAVVRVRNLANGLEAELRVNDRGPANPGRVVELSPRAAELLRIPRGGAAPVRVSVVAESSRALAGSLPGTENAPLAIEAAPVGRVQAEQLAPPPGARQAERLRSAPARAQPAATVAGPDLAAVPLRLPERVSQAAPEALRIFVEAATFSRRDLAERQRAQLAHLGAQVEAFWANRATQNFRVRVGPLPDLAAADAALERMLRAGVSEARILLD
jgi:rare lipoprotein A